MKKRIRRRGYLFGGEILTDYRKYGIDEVNVHAPKQNERLLKMIEKYDPNPITEEIKRKHKEKG